MKKMALLAVILALFAGFNLVYAAEEQVQPPAQMQEFISQQMPDVMLKALDALLVAEVDRNFFSTEGNDVIDFVVLSFAAEERMADVLFLGAKPDFRVGLRLTPAKNEKGELIPDKYSTELMAVVLYYQNMAWYKSADAKAIFEKATR